MKNQKKKLLNQIDILIKKEQQLASQIIPEKILKAHLKKRLEKESRNILFPYRRRTKIIITASSITAFIFVGVTILIFFQKEYHEIGTVSSMAQFFKETPGVKNLIQMNIERSDTLPYRPMAAGMGLQSIKKTIQNFQSAYSSPSLKKFEQISTQDSPHYDYSQKIEILFHKKVIHRVIYKYWQKKEEGKNG